MKHLLGSSGVAMLFLGCFSLVVLSQARDRTKQRGERRRAEAPMFDGAAVPGWDPASFPAMVPGEPFHHRRSGWRRLLDSDANGEISLDEIDLMAMNLKALDVDQNGRITDDELPPTMSWHGGSPPFDAEAAFAPQSAEVARDQQALERE